MKKIFESLYRLWANKKSSRYVKYLRGKGVKVGQNVFFRHPWTSSVDLTRPSLIEFGNNIRINRNCRFVTHDFVSIVFLKVYGELLSSSGRIKIGNNVYIGPDTIVMKGVTIGNNCIIGVRSVVTKDVPDNSVAIGSPARVVCTLDEYYRKRKKEYVDEALDYARSIQENWGRRPVPSDFWEEFPLFLRADELPDGIPVKSQLGPAYEHYRKYHIPVYESFDHFLKNAGL